MSDNNKSKIPNNLRPNSLTIIIVGLLLWAVGFSLVSSFFGGQSVKEVSFTDFWNMVESDSITGVVEMSNPITFTAKDANGKEKKYKVIYDAYTQDPELGSLLRDHKVKYKSLPKNIFSETILPLVLNFALIFIFFMLISRILAKRMGGNSMSFGKINSKVYVQSKPGKSFKDVAGQDEAKEALTEVVDFLHDPRKYSEIGAVLPKGVLLVGPPGTGKTLLAQAVAGEANVPFFSMSGSEFVELFVGMGASKVRDLFKQAKEKAPCIVFIDEIDAIGKKRDTHGLSGNDEREQTLNQLLNEMDGFDGNAGVVILGATNRPEILDQALTRPGRFDRQVPVELPDLSGREAILKVHAKKVKTEENIDYKAIALMTAGASGAQLANIINEAALRAVKVGHKLVHQDDLQESVEVVIAGQQKKGMVISPREKRMIAYHEVGHALVAALQKHSAPVTKITIIPRTSGALGYTMQVDEEEKFLMSKEEIFNEIVTFTGGRTAEELIFNTQTTGAANDIERATKLARAMITQYGMTKEFGMVAWESQQARYLDSGTSSVASQNKASQIDDMVEQIIKDAQEKAREILSENIEKLHEISEFLIEKETITGDEFMEILDLDSPKKENTTEETPNDSNNNDIEASNVSDTIESSDNNSEDLNLDDWENLDV
ncbi:ATP-dependent zinc metalloprotease FtsH [Miniphocaeibacter massiliensis]|uniref:ATP-dependent zinc metalloprotease FtsH n=1 Tax=Miniphocaeibacter massiliensis TaxID=2041841 RepID=UPI000C1C6EF5|nr:ATP-dependent zinc metalloprotease FtsH [Miniphocaeibacter massiliensis]